MPPIRRTVFFSGNVQGVGFRAATCGVARKHQVGGTVRNLLDGRVELIAEGSVSAVDEFIEEIGETMGQYIEHITCSDSTARGKFESFKIAY